LTFAFREGYREHRKLCEHEPDTEGRGQDKFKTSHVVKKFTEIV